MHHSRPVVILIVEDEPLIRMALEDTLRDAGFDVLAAPDADEALEILLLRTDIRAMVTDHVMPGSMKGAALARLIGQKNPDLPVILTSGGGLSVGDIPAGVQFVPKPYNFDRMVDIVRKSIRAKDVGNRACPMPIPVSMAFHKMNSDLGHVGGLAQPLQAPEK